MGCDATPGSGCPYNPRVRSLLAAVAGAVLSILAFPPYGIGGFIVPALILFLVSIRWASRPSAAWAAGWTYGLISFGFLFPWLGELGVIAFLPLLVVQAAYPAVYARLLFGARGWSAGRWWAAATGGWALMELARERFPIGGFPWGMAGYPLGEYAAVRGAAQWIGTSGWSVVIAGLAAALALVVTAPPIRGAVARLTAIMAGIFVALVVVGAAVPSRADGREVRVAIVQGNTPCPGTRCPDERYRTYQNHVRLTRQLAPGGLDLVVWPEGSMGGFNADPINSAEVRAELAAEVARLGAVLLAGTDRPLDDAHWVNANIVFDQTGSIVGEYRKRHPVPFGEYIPARRLFSWIEVLDAVPRDMIPGHGPVVFDLGFGPFGSVISFEGSFSRYARDAARSGAACLVADLAAAMAAVGPTLNRYPDRDATALREDLADYLGRGLTASHVWPANGSNEVLQQLLQAFGGVGRSALGFEPSYSMHRLISIGTSTRWIAVPRGEDFALDADLGAASVAAVQPDVVFLCSPNNRPGTALDADTVAAVYDAAPGMVVVDEAYTEFSRRPRALDLLPGRPRLVVTRTLSKACALAGARVGYLVADPAVV
ncbi:MAG: apolipoprotein N-acyltransferase, partial [Acidimicrobiia bacterium]